MARKLRPTKYTILIVCEGTATEPNYFKGLSNEAGDHSTELQEILVAIDPKPKDDQTPKSAFNPHKTARKKRELQHRDTIVTGEIEPKYAADPIRYVRTAQLGLLDGTFDEAHAVFDKDDHPMQKEAFELAREIVNGKKVQIGFSSIAFEHWVLLHYELNLTPFEKSECKDASGKILGCGRPGIKAGCKGTKCVAGYLRENGHHKYDKNGKSLWNDLRARSTKAFRHAAALRFNMQSTNPARPIYDLNPYTDLDLVIAKVLRLPSYIVSKAGQSVLYQDLKYSVDLPTNEKVTIQVQNQKNEAYLFNSQVFFSDNVAEKVAFSTVRKLFQPGESVTFNQKIPASIDQTLGFINIEMSPERILAVPLPK